MADKKLDGNSSKETCHPVIFVPRERRKERVSDGKIMWMMMMMSLSMLILDYYSSRCSRFTLFTVQLNDEEDEDF